MDSQEIINEVKKKMPFTYSNNDPASEAVLLQYMIAEIILILKKNNV